jgi:hypothetical protein
MAWSSNVLAAGVEPQQEHCNVSFTTKPRLAQMPTVSSLMCREALPTGLDSAFLETAHSPMCLNVWTLEPGPWAKLGPILNRHNNGFLWYLIETVFFLAMMLHIKTVFLGVSTVRIVKCLIHMKLLKQLIMNSNIRNLEFGRRNTLREEHRLGVGARGSVVGWDTMLQTGRSWVRFPMRPLDFSVDLILPAALGSTQPLNENEYQDSSWG